jgi:membrane associated rhomboid family serine protease
MYQGRSSFLANIPQAVRGLLIINAAVLLSYYIIGYLFNININMILGMYFFKSELFEPYQIATHMFMHADFWHLLFNMYALWMFGQVIERVWGSKRFLIYYLITGFGAAILHTLVIYYQYYEIVSSTNFNNNEFIAIMTTPTVGASGAVYGILLAFGMLFPNVQLQIIFIPIPIKAKYFVIFFAVLELFYGVSNIPGDNIAHFAHLGGMIFGFIMIKIWGKGKPKGGNFYREY